MCNPIPGQAAEGSRPQTYRHIGVEEADETVVSITAVPDRTPPRWARDVSQKRFGWSTRPGADRPFFARPIPYVIPPADEGEPFHPHNHQPSIAWLPNGDLLAIWYSTAAESGTELTVLASRLRAGAESWDPSSEFLKAPDRNMHGSSILHDGKGAVYHFNGMGPAGGKGWAKLALLMRTSRDNGVTWTPARAALNSDRVGAIPCADRASAASNATTRSVRLFMDGSSRAMCSGPTVRRRLGTILQRVGRHP
ncbi:MAG: exo-alpha-sialidase [Armatimonadetes bacterium]|nr:exo-alpha-sialidase [Armatimonadota bacterium]